MPLLNGKPFMSAFLKDILATKKGDTLHGTMFEVNGDVMLDPLAENPESTRFGTVLVNAIKRGVDVRILVNNNVYIQSGITTGFCSEINKYCSNGGDCCIPDSRVAYHGKCSIFFCYSPCNRTTTSTV